MSRQPVHLLVASKKPTGRQAIWQLIRVMRDGFTVAGLAVATDIPRATIKSYLQCLEAAGHIERIELVEAIPTACNGAYRLINDIGVEAPRVTKDGKPVTQGLPREQMWRTMKILTADFSWRDLAIAASTEAVPVAETDAKDYCKHLAQAGYLLVVSKGKPLGRVGQPTRYRFNRAKNTGPKSPMVQRIQTIFDPNLGQIVWHPEVDA